MNVPSPSSASCDSQAISVPTGSSEVRFFTAGANVADARGALNQRSHEAVFGQSVDEWIRSENMLSAFSPRHLEPNRLPLWDTADNKMVPRSEPGSTNQRRSFQPTMRSFCGSSVSAVHTQTPCSGVGSI